MPIYQTDGNLIAAQYMKSSGKKYLPEISKRIVAKFGTGPFTTAGVTETLWFAFNWYCDLFLQLAQSETEVAFYQSLFGLHEFASKLHGENPNKSPAPGLMTDGDFAMYRRVLKLCLEQACDLDLVRNKQFPTGKYLKRKERLVDELLFTGEKIYEVFDALSQQHLIDDCIDLKFKEDGTYYFANKHHYGRIMFEINKETNDHLSYAVIGKNEQRDFKAAIKRCLNVDFEEGIATIIAMQERNQKHGGKMAMEEWYAYPSNFSSLFNVTYENAETFYKGLTLDRNNKMPLKEAIQKPQHLNKYLYRPFLVWNVDGVERTIVGLSILTESVVSLYSNAIAWKKYPPEWKSECFVEYVNRKAGSNDKILEDEAELLLQKHKAIYSRNVTALKRWDNKNFGIDTQECGEIDFLILIDNVLYVADSKHLLSRYDMSTYRNDYAAFETNKKAYNATAVKKVNFLKKRVFALEEHFQVELNDRQFRLGNVQIEAIFIVNTPTFMMYNNPFRIYTLRDFKLVLDGKYTDKVYKVPVVEGESKTMQISYPYFKKPDYRVFDGEIND